MELTSVLKITLFALSGGFLVIAKDFEGPDIPIGGAPRKDVPSTAQNGFECGPFTKASLAFLKTS